MRLSTELLLSAYCQGMFPMAHDDGEIYWYDPDPRAILPLDQFHTPRSLQRILRSERFEIRHDTEFEAVVRACAGTGPSREETWINDEIVDAYCRLHRHGFAHSVETWHAGGLVGGLYGVSIGGFFAGESMFSTQRDASKAALAQLVDHLRAKGFRLLDIQFMTDHLRQFGAMEVSRSTYKEMLASALAAQVGY